jgi:C1A family cysteine protease
MEPFTGVTNADSIDWREVGDVVTPVKDQGQCGSCWAFSATEAVESAYVIAGNDQVIMAPQELVDCARGMFTSHGCSGGWYYYAWEWLGSHKTMKESDYPYTSGAAGQETTCAYDESVGVTNVSSY